MMNQIKDLELVPEKIKPMNLVVFKINVSRYNSANKFCIYHNIFINYIIFKTTYSLFSLFRNLSFANYANTLFKFLNYCPDLKDFELDCYYQTEF